jgi:hypothetical protein
VSQIDADWKDRDNGINNFTRQDRKEIFLAVSAALRAINFIALRPRHPERTEWDGFCINRIPLGGLRGFARNNFFISAFSAVSAFNGVSVFPALTIRNFCHHPSLPFPVSLPNQIKHL